jgi:hypothetical protein
MCFINNNMPIFTVKVRHDEILTFEVEANTLKEAKEQITSGERGVGDEDDVESIRYDIIEAE